MVEWLAGNRIRGTSAEKPVASLQSPSVGGWVELARTTLGSAGDAIDVSSLADKRYYMVLTNFLNSGSYDANLRLGSGGTLDTGSNYSDRVEYDGGADVTRTSQTSAYTYNGGNAYPAFQIDYISNLASKEKLIISEYNRGTSTGAGNAPGRSQQVAKWANTSNALDIIGWNNGSAGDYSIGSECVVLGWDDSDTHTTNFWEELASVNGTGATSFNSGVFTSKKYLWVQMYIDRSADATNGEITVGNTTLDTTNNYSRRRSADGGADDTLINQPNIALRTAGLKEFYNMFIINNSANEKLIILHQNAGGTAGAGNAPYRGEFVAKWANTSSQIDIIGFGSGGSNTLSSTSTMKVWGSD